MQATLLRQYMSLQQLPSRTESVAWDTAQLICSSPCFIDSVMLARDDRVTYIRSASLHPFTKRRYNATPPTTSTNPAAVFALQSTAAETQNNTSLSPQGSGLWTQGTSTSKQGQHPKKTATEPSAQKSHSVFRLIP
jgi:hypothetical protein